MIGHVLYALKQTARLLTFQSLEIKSLKDKRVLLIAAMLFALIAGIGRYWDHPSAYAWQYFGLGSFVYIFALSAVIWLLGWPLKPPKWSYSMVLIFVGLTSPLAWLYAIPVERFTPIDTAIKLNIWFLIIVAVWRVALYGRFLKYAAKMQNFHVFICLFLPLGLIVFALTTLNLEQAVFEIMAGLEQDRTDSELIRDNTYAVVFLITALSLIITPIIVLLYFFAIIARRTELRRMKSEPKQ